MPQIIITEKPPLFLKGKSFLGNISEKKRQIIIIGGLLFFIVIVLIIAFFFLGTDYSKQLIEKASLFIPVLLKKD